jgi:hypothetical protein
MANAYSEVNFSSGMLSASANHMMPFEIKAWTLHIACSSAMN